MRRLSLVPVLLLAAMPFLTACEVDPFCLNCADEDGSTPDGDGDVDSDADGDGDSDGDTDVDADADGSCDPEAEEICNGIDDNCDGEVDEGFDLMTDARHCGRCNNPCLLAHAFNDCVDGECVITGCDVCFHDIDGDADNGCEYACCQTVTPTVPGSCEGDGVDCCDGIDNDCDGEFDEDHDTSNDPNNCGGCSATCEGAECAYDCNYPYGEAGCSDGTCYLAGCVLGHHDIDGDDENGCEYACTLNPDTGGVEQCNSRDDDCDGEVDESFDHEGEICGSDVGACTQGVRTCVSGHDVCLGEVESALEVCDGDDNDCDGETDEDDPTVGGGCGTDMGVCTRGTWACVSGALECAGSVPPGTETCNNLDDDCDGIVDDGVPDAGSCGTDTGACSTGTMVCLGGTFVCDGSVGPVPEDCDGVDNDCDGSVDESLVRDCSSSCGIGEEVCASGAWGTCSARTPDTEICDGVDNDCDGLVDEDDGGGPLTRACSFLSCAGVERCTAPFTWSSCSVAPSPETCNNVDDDCDGDVDEDVTRSCANECGPGEEICTTGTWGTCSARTPETEICDGIDNDCDGMIDEDDTGATMTRDCSFLSCTGVETCTAAFTWTGCTAVASTEVCNNADDDCDGDVDEGLSRSCSTLCGPGEELCVGGSWDTCSARVPTTETCNGIDDDCDGVTDEDSSGGPLTRACAVGLCTGIETCTGPSTWTGCTASSSTEVCDGVDNDCDGDIDEGTAFESDPTNCGSCDHDCTVEFPNSVVVCSEPSPGAGGVCSTTGCIDGWWDTDPATPGCEYACTYSGSEICDGIDNDCNDAIDDGWTAPDFYCGRHGVCAAVTVECVDPDGAGPALAALHCPDPTDYQDPETWCDGLDNDCDGLTDEGYWVGTETTCVNGPGGLCEVPGHYECDPAGRTNDPICVRNTGEPDPLTLATDEVCNGIDDDCDGDIDDSIALVDMDVISVTRDVDLDGDGMLAGGEYGRSFYMFTYEASHPDATALDAGTIWTWACSNETVEPWTGLSWRDAQAACCGLNSSRTCDYQTVTASDGSMYVPRGWALCTAPDWEASCQSGNHPLDPEAGGAPWVYPYESDTYDDMACNGYDAGEGMAMTTGYGSCTGGIPAGTDDHWDMSGNVHEWTWTGWFVCGCDRNPSSCESGCDCDPNCGCGCDTDSALRGHGSRCQYGCDCDPDCNTFYEYRGGGFYSTEQAMTCQWDFNVGADRSDEPGGGGDPEPGLALDTLGFRCCYYP